MPAVPPSRRDVDSPRPADAAGPGSTRLDRRAVLVGGVAALATAASGCGIRLEPDAPPVPLVPVRAVGEPAVWVWREIRWVRRARTAAAAAHPPTLARLLADAHERQEEVLLGRLRELGEDPSDAARLDAAAGPAPAPAALPVAEAGGLAAGDLTQLGSWPSDEAPLLLSLRTQRAVASRRLGGRAPVPPIATTASAEEAARLVAVLRSAEYGVEVAAARSSDATRRRLAGARGWVSATRLALEPLAGRLDAGEPLGYTLPKPVTDDASALALARVVLSATTDALVAGAAPAGGGAAAMRSLLHWATEAELIAVELGAALRPFPGLIRR